MSPERFRSAKSNENIFVWKRPDQHSCTLRTARGKDESRCMAVRHQSSLLLMALTDLLMSRIVNRASWDRVSTSVLEKNWLKSLIITKYYFHLSPVLLTSFTWFYDSLHGTKKGAIPIRNKRRVRKVSTLAGSRFPPRWTRHKTQPSVLNIIEKSSGRRGCQVDTLPQWHTSAVRSVSKSPTSSRENKCRALGESKRRMLECEPEKREEKKTGRKRGNSSFSWNMVGAGFKKAHRQSARRWQMKFRLWHRLLK